MKHLSRVAVLAAISTLVLAGCSSESPDSTTSSGASGTSSTPTDPLKIAYASDLDPNDIADQFGIRASGADWTALTEDSAVTAGLQNGNFDIGNIDVTAAIKAIQAGVPIKIIYVSQNKPEFVLVAQSDITSLSDLAGKTVAYHAPGSLTEILERELVRQNDPDLEDKINWVVLPESPNRAAAMLAGRIDATTLEYLDVLALKRQGDFNVLQSWADLTGPSGDAIATVWVASDKFLANNQDRVVNFLDDVQAGYDTVYADKGAWMSLAEELVPDIATDDLSAAYDYYTAGDMYPKSGVAPITPERWAGLDEFFTQIGEYDQPAPIDDVDLDIVNKVAGV